MNEKIYIFDEEGSRFEVHNVEAMLDELPKDGLEMIYKSTRYFHEFNKTVLKLIELGKIELQEGEPYDVDGVENGLKHFRSKIIETFGQDGLDRFDAETDAQWEENKPDGFNI